MMTSIFYVFLSVFALGVQGQTKPVDLVPGAVYQILNKVDGGVLTVDERSMGSVLVFLREYNSTAGQKWRLRAATTGQSWQLSPTSNEKAVLDLDASALGKWGRIFTFGSERYWNLRQMGESEIQIQNWQKPDFCLTTQGLSKLVGVADCENSPTQQWMFNAL